MNLAEFVTETKVYLKIKETDIDNDAIIEQAASAAAGFILAQYSFYILDASLVKETQADGPYKKFYLDAGPVKAVTPFVNDVEVTDNTVKIFNNVAYFTNNLGQLNDFVKLNYTVGIDLADIGNIGDVAQACALAGYFYKQADKGLVGVEQYGTGIKESARLYDGIPRAILDYFQARKIYRL